MRQDLGGNQHINAASAFFDGGRLLDDRDIYEPGTDLVPLFKGNTADVTTQFDMKGVERIGLLKMDFLGLRTLTLIDNCVKMIEAQLGVRIDPAAIPLDDTRTSELFTAGKTSGLFQFESDGMRDILKRFRPDRLEHLTALNALYRPGPMQMIDDFIKRRHGQTRVSYEAPQLEPILQGTYGIMVYQEQVMQIASALAGRMLPRLGYRVLIRTGLAVTFCAGSSCEIV